MDSTKNAYVSGSTYSANFPTGVTTPLYSFTNASANVFVAKIDAGLTGNASLLYSTSIGGPTGGTGRGIAVDSQDNAVLTGETNGNNFPLLND